MHSAVVSAIDTLKGPLHGGANEAVMKMLRDIGDVEKVEAYVENMIANKQKVMGFGHRVYKAKDPRAVILEEMSEELGTRSGDAKWFEMSRIVEEIFQPTVAAKGIYPNVDFYSRLDLPRHGHSRRYFHADFRLLARRRLDGAHHAAIRQQSHLPPQFRLCWP